VVASLVILFAPHQAVPNAPEGVDKVVHVTLFLALCASGLVAGVRARWLVPVLVTYALASEVIQASPVLGRTASGWDALADVAGIAVGLALVWAGARRSWGNT
jgi:VanZ family protein